MSLFGNILAALVLFALPGCYDSHNCGLEDLCDNADDDCDGRVDETFVDDTGMFTSPEHCGGCNVRCADVFPSAAETACEIDMDAGIARCVLVACPLGQHAAGDGACVSDVPVLCLPCETDADCTIRLPGSVCFDLARTKRCLPPCGTGCQPGFECTRGIEGISVCTPATGDCACTVETLGAEFACLIGVEGSDHQCAGSQTCNEDGLGPCESAVSEACNEQDDDCDSSVDEDFRDDAGLYIARLHCGGCAVPCVEPGPNMIAECLPDPRSPTGTRCSVECDEGFVDVDRLSANGCECERFDGMGPPPIIGGDSNCDGIPEDDDDFIFVTSTGNDRNPGTLVRPMRTIAAALDRGRATRKDVLVSRGIYDGPFDLLGGVNVFGGYRPDFADRNLELYPVLVERRAAPPGSAVLTCRNITTATQVDGFTIVGTDATAASEGSTAVYLDQCSSTVTLSNLAVVAGRGAAGSRGDDSSANLADWGLRSLSELDGLDGVGGIDSNDMTCTTLSGGAGGRRMCPFADSGGGNGGGAGCPNTGCSNGRPCGNAGCTDFTVGGVCDFDAVLRAAVSNPAAEDGRGLSAGVAGEVTYNAPTNRGVCSFCDDNPTLGRAGGNGSDGSLGVDGGAGNGCNAAPAFDASTGRLSGSVGGDGADGSDGSGGGGGTAGSGYAVIAGTEAGCADRSGGSGGGGGSGGCGAPRADGGGGGGASVGIAVRLRAMTATGPTFDGVRVVTASGGGGGDGGIGASGGAPGSGGNGGTTRFWCSRTGGRGGDGGSGGSGGGGGGGCGGGTHGVLISAGGADVAAYRASVAAAVSVEATGVPGDGGSGGFSPGAPGGNGVQGDGTPVAVQ